MSTATAQVTITPAMMAEAFWQMKSDKQVEFFALLGNAIKADYGEGNRSAYSLGELQWFFVGDKLLEPSNKLARDMLMTMAAPLYLHTLRASGEFA